MRFLETLNSNYIASAAVALFTVLVLHVEAESSDDDSFGYQLDLEAAFKKSVAVAIVEIAEIGREVRPELPHGCGREYGADVVRSFGGAEDMLHFRARANLVVGREYLVFLTRDQVPSGTPLYSDLGTHPYSEDCAQDSTNLTLDLETITVLPQEVFFEYRENFSIPSLRKTHDVFLASTELAPLLWSIGGLTFRSSDSIRLISPNIRPIEYWETGVLDADGGTTLLAFEAKAFVEFLDKLSKTHW